MSESEVQAAKDRQARAEEKKQKWIAVQKRAFIHWINTYLDKAERHIDDLETGFSDGVNLILFLEQLTGESLGKKYSATPKFTVHKITNCVLALNFLKTFGVRLTISAEQIVEVEHISLMLGFCWMLLRRFQVNWEDDSNKNSSYEQRLLDWCRSLLADYDDIDIVDFTSFNNGRALLGLVEQFDKRLVNYREFDKSDAANTCKTALDLAFEGLGIPNDLIDAEELAAGQVSEKNLVLYLTLFYNTFRERKSLNSKENIIARIQAIEEEITSIQNTKLSLGTEKEQLIKSIEELKANLADLQEQIKSIEEWEKNELNGSWITEKEDLLTQMKTLESDIQNLHSSFDEATASLQSKRDELMEQKDQLIEDIAKLEHENKSLEKKIAIKSKEVKIVNKASKLEAFVETTSATHEFGIDVLQKHLLNHMRDVNIWTPFIEEAIIGVEHKNMYPDDDFKEGEIADRLKRLEDVLTKENEKFSVLLDEKMQQALLIEKQAIAAAQPVSARKKRKRRD